MTKYERTRIEQEISKKGLKAVIKRLNSHYIRTDSFDVKKCLDKQLNYINRVYNI